MCLDNHLVQPLEYALQGMQSHVKWNYMKWANRMTRSERECLSKIFADWTIYVIAIIRYHCERRFNYATLASVFLKPLELFHVESLARSVSRAISWSKEQSNVQDTCDGLFSRRERRERKGGRGKRRQKARSTTSEERKCATWDNNLITRRVLSKNHKAINNVH